MIVTEKRRELKAPPPNKIAWRITGVKKFVAAITGHEGSAVWVKPPKVEGEIVARTWYAAREEAIRLLAEKNHYYDRDTCDVAPVVTEVL
jgi:hypothetical protein